jgi:alkanesulfonate monooxygenase SsuD/methylene tetrahydromethanopterin reductase-like flavin-dependent oxidoreductase (luciferase family)
MVAARLGIGALGFGFETPEEAEERVARYYELVRGIRRPIGKAINPALVSVGNMFCAPTDEQAAAYGIPGAQFFGLAIGWTLNPRGVNWGHDHVYREFLRRTEGMTAAERDAATANEPEDESARTLYRAARRGLFIGSPNFIRDNLRRYEAAHMDGVFFLVQVGNRSSERIMESMELFAREVLPEFKDRHHLHQKWREQQLDGVKFPVNSSI